MHGSIGYYKTHSNSNAFYAAIIVAAIHLVAVLLFLYANKTADTHPGPLSSLQMIKPVADISETTPILEPPLIDFQPGFLPIQLAELDIAQSVHADLTRIYSAADTPYQLPDKNADLYPDVFDPRLRKKLQDAHANRKPVKKDLINTWVSGETTLAEVGDGECVASMPKTDSRDRGTSWSMIRVKCGKSDSEKMMDNINADLEARKHPLGAQ